MNNLNQILDVVVAVYNRHRPKGYPAIDKSNVEKWDSMKVNKGLLNYILGIGGEASVTLTGELEHVPNATKNELLQEYLVTYNRMFPEEGKKDEGDEDQDYMFEFENDEERQPPEDRRSNPPQRRIEMREVQAPVGADAPKKREEIVIEVNNKVVVGQDKKRLITKAENEAKRSKNIAWGSNNVSTNYDACNEAIASWNSSSVVSKNGPTALLIATVALEAKLHVNAEGIQGISDIPVGSMFLTSSSVAIKLISEGKASYAGNSVVVATEEIETAKYVGISTLIKKNHIWSVGKTSLRSVVIRGTMANCTKEVSTTKLAFVPYQESDLVRKTVVPFGPEAFSPDVLFSIAVAIQKKKLNMKMFNNLALKLNANHMYEFLMDDNNGYSNVKKEAIAKLIMSKTFVERTHPEFRLITNRTLYLASDQADLKKAQLASAENLKNKFSLFGLGDTTKEEDIAVGRNKTRKIGKQKFLGI